MNKINLLSEELINQIAAGEVVERPSSALKEILENAIDAKANLITVEINEFGVGSIKVRDNGSGMSREDAILCLERHATSKISSLEDLENIATMGFRGEALASIASISKLTITTRQEEDLAATKLISEAGRILAVEDAAAPVGTFVEINDLFFNVPARKKFLKSESTELENLIGVVTNAALAYPEIAWKLIVDGKINLDLAATDKLQIRIRSLFGSSFSDKMLELFNGSINLGIRGYVGKPEIARSSKNHQYLFVNGRPIKSSVLSYAVKQAFYSLIPKEKNPVFVIFLDIPANLVDVNVHPRKTEVKFRDEREVFRQLQATVSKALEKQIIAPVWQENQSSNYYQSAERDFTPVSSGAISEPVTSSIQELTASRELTHRSLFDRENTPVQLPLVQTENTLAFADFTILGQHDRSFIIVSRGEDLWLIDQHAAHERVRYQELLVEAENENKVVQPLLTPLMMELGPTDIAILNANKDFFEQMGIEIEHFGGNSFCIQSVPAILVNQDLNAMVLGILDDLRSSGGKGDFFARREKILTYIACRSAVKFGDTLSFSEMDALLKKWLACEQRFTCPHGRPALLQLTKNELWKRFGRDYAGMQKNLNWAELGC